MFVILCIALNAFVTFSQTWESMESYYGGRALSKFNDKYADKSHGMSTLLLSFSA